MEDWKKIFKFYAKAGEDFNLWIARTQAALVAKDVGHTIQSDLMGVEDTVSEENVKSIATACAIIIQGLGDKPLRFCLSDRENPFGMWKRLSDRCYVSNTATRVQSHAKPSKMIYSAQSMGDYVDGFEEVFNRLAVMGSNIPEDMQIAMFLSSFGDLTKSSYGNIFCLP